MGTTIRVSEQTKELLERRKRADETFDDLLARLATEGDDMVAGAWSDETAAVARERLERSRESFGTGR
ncbi:MAG: antitoxin VapB family protein [Halapricum sp.]